MITDREMDIRILEVIVENDELEERIIREIAGKRGQNAIRRGSEEVEGGGGPPQGGGGGVPSY